MRRTPLTTAVSKALRGLGFPLGGETIVVGLSGGPDSVALLDGLAAAGGDGLEVGGGAPGSRPAYRLRGRCGLLRRAVRAAGSASAPGVRRRARAGDAGGLWHRGGRPPRALWLPGPRDGRGWGGGRRRGPHARRSGRDAPVAAAARRRQPRLGRHACALGPRRAAASLGESAAGAPASRLPRPRMARGPYQRRYEASPQPREARAAALPRVALQPPSSRGPGPNGGAAGRGGRHADRALGRSVDGRGEAGRPDGAADRHAAFSAARTRPPGPSPSPRGGRRPARHRHGSRGAHPGDGRFSEVLRTATAAPRRARGCLPLPRGGDRTACGRASSILVARPRARTRAAAGGKTLVARSCRGPAASRDRSAVVAMDPGEPLVVRTRQPGDRLRTAGREVSLRRFLMERRVPADQRPRLPLVASGRHVLWVPGQPIEPAAEAGRGFVRLELEGQP